MWREAAKLCFATVSMLALASCARSGEPADATHVRVTNNPNHFADADKRALSELEQHDGEYIWPDWDLDLNLCLQRRCPDGRRQVHAQFYDEAGYVSPVYSAEVMLDRKLPEFSHYELSGKIATTTASCSCSSPTKALRFAPDIRMSPAARCAVQIRAKVSCWSSPTCKTSTIPERRWSTQDWQRTGG